MNVSRSLRSITALGALVAAARLGSASATAEGIRGSDTYRPEILGRVGVVAAGRHFAAEAGMRMLARGGNAVDAGVAATFAAAVSEISHFGLGGEVPIILYLADRRSVVVINGQGSAPAAASPEYFRRLGEIPPSGALAGSVPAVVDALAIALAEFGTLSLAEVLAPAVDLADGFPWYDYLTRVLTGELTRCGPFRAARASTCRGRAARSRPSGASSGSRTLPAPCGPWPPRSSDTSPRDERRRSTPPATASTAATSASALRRAVQEAGGLLTARDLAAYRGRVEAPTSRTFRTRHGSFEIFKTGFWGQGPVLLQALALLQGFDLERMGHNSVAYIHAVSEALKLALADRDAYYGDPDFAKVPATGLLSEAYAAERRKLIDSTAASHEIRPGDPWKFDLKSEGAPRAPDPRHAIWVDPATATGTDYMAESPDTTTVNVADAQGNLFSASPSSAWFFGGVFIAGDTGVPLGNRMQAFVLNENDHPNIVRGGKRPRTTLTPTVVLRDGRPFLALSSPGGDSQDQQALQVLLNIAVFGMRPQAAIEAPRFNSLHHHRSFGHHGFGDKDGRAGVLEVENRVAPDIVEALRRLGHRVDLQGPFMQETGTTLAGVDSDHGTLFGAADVRRQRFAVGW